MDYALSKLNDREKDVLIKMYRDERSYKSLAEEYGVTYERIRQIEENAIEKLCYYKLRTSVLLGVIPDDDEEEDEIVADSEDEKDPVAQKKIIVLKNEYLLDLPVEEYFKNQRVYQ